MLSQREAIQFVEDKLNIPDPMVVKIRSPLTLLNIIIKRFQCRIPFQNITLLAQKIGTHDVPSIETIIQDGLEGVGGLCYTNNVFMKLLLAALGYEVHHVASTVDKNNPNDHIAIGALNVVNTGDCYLVDVGFGYPTYQAIPINFEEESPVYTDCGLKYKFPHKAGEVYERVHHSSFRGDMNGSCPGWQWYNSFTLSPVTLDYFKSAMQEVYQDQFLRKIRVSVLQETRMLAIKEHADHAIYMDINSTGTKRTPLQNEDQISSAISKLLPQLDEKLMQAALENCKYFKKKKQMHVS